MPKLLVNHFKITSLTIGAGAKAAAEAKREVNMTDFMVAFSSCAEGRGMEEDGISHFSLGGKILVLGGVTSNFI